MLIVDQRGSGWVGSSAVAGRASSLALLPGLLVGLLAGCLEEPVVLRVLVDHPVAERLAILSGRELTAGRYRPRSCRRCLPGRTSGAAHNRPIRRGWRRPGIP